MSLNKFVDGTVKKEWMNINCASIVADSVNGKSLYGVEHVQTTDVIVANDNTEEDITTTASVDLNKLNAGDCGEFNLSGICTNNNTTTTIFRLYGGQASDKLLFTFLINARDTAGVGSSFELRTPFTIRTDGEAGEASIFLTGVYTQQVDGATANAQGMVFSGGDGSVFSTTVVNNFKWTVQFSEASGANSIVCQQFRMLL